MFHHEVVVDTVSPLPLRGVMSYRTIIPRAYALSIFRHRFAVINNSFIISRNPHPHGEK